MPKNVKESARGQSRRQQHTFGVRGLIGIRSRYLTATRGQGLFSSKLKGYEPYKGDMLVRKNGTLIADRTGKATDYALAALEERGVLFIKPGTEVYEGMIIGERNNDEDLEVNITKEKKLTNHRASGSDETIPLRPPQLMSLDQCIEFIAENEFVEITPKSIRLRKTELNATQRALQKKKQNKT